MNHFEILKKVILENSIGDNWEAAVMEWEIRSLREDPSSSSICVCNKKGLRYCFTIQNVKNGRQLHPIGSTCIKKFGRKDLDISVDTWEKMYHLQEDVKKNKYISISSEYFSKSILGYLYQNGAFPPTAYNGGKGENDYELMLKKFNHAKLTEKQERKVRAILVNQIIPFVRKNFCFAKC